MQQRNDTDNLSQEQLETPAHHTESFVVELAYEVQPEANGRAWTDADYDRRDAAMRLGYPTHIGASWQSSSANSSPQAV